MKELSLLYDRVKHEDLQYAEFVEEIKKNCKPITAERLLYAYESSRVELQNLGKDYSVEDHMKAMADELNGRE